MSFQRILARENRNRLKISFARQFHGRLIGTEPCDGNFRKGAIPGRVISKLVLLVFLRFGGSFFGEPGIPEPPLVEERLPPPHLLPNQQKIPPPLIYKHRSPS